MSDRELLRLKDMPVYQNKMFDSAVAALDCPRGDVVIAQDAQTGLVSNIAFDPSKLDYDVTYQNEQGHSAAFQGHLSDVLEKIDRNFGSDTILEVGCGKGAFLEQLRELNHDAWGIDPAYQGDAPYVIKAAFHPDLGIRRDAIVMRHVLEHISGPMAFLKLVKEANGGRGQIYVEVPCFDWILRKHAWFDIFYEHVNYFRLSDFDNMFENVRESGYLFGGQYIYVVADLASLRDVKAFNPHDPISIPEAFFAGMTRSLSLGRPNSRRIIWGAGAKGVMFAHHLRRLGLNLDAAVDINPAKQGKFLAASGIPVVSPKTILSESGAETDIFVMNSNYLAEIKAMAGPEFNFITVDEA